MKTKRQMAAFLRKHRLSHIVININEVCATAYAMPDAHHPEVAKRRKEAMEKAEQPMSMTLVTSIIRDTLYSVGGNQGETVEEALAALFARMEAR